MSQDFRHLNSDKAQVIVISPNCYSQEDITAFHFDGKVSCNRVNGISVSATPPPSLVSALRHFSERAGSQHYTRLL